MSAKLTIFRTVLVALSRSKPNTLAQRHRRALGVAAYADAKRSTCGIYSKTYDWDGPNRNLIPFGAVPIAPPPAPKVSLAGALGPAERPAAPAESPATSPRWHHLRGQVAATGIAATIAAVSLAFSASPASALSKHVFSTSFAGSGTSALSNPTAVAVDNSGGPSNGDVYVSDPEHFRVEKFTASGEFILMFGKGVDKTTGGDVCTAASGDECQAGSAGSAPGAFTAPSYLALDDSPGGGGDLYVGDPGDGTVSKFDPAGNLVSSWGSAGQLDGSTTSQGSFTIEGQSIFGLAVDPSGTLLVPDGAHHSLLFEFAQDGDLLAEINPATGFRGSQAGRTTTFGLAAGYGQNYYIEGANRILDFVGSTAYGAVASERDTPATGLALTPQSGELYVAREGGIEQFAASCEPTLGIEFSTACTPLETFGAADLANPGGLAVDETTGAVYVANGGDHDVAVFAAVPYLPAATASAVPATPTSEGLAGTADPAGAGELQQCAFQYAPLAAFAQIDTLTLSGATGGTFELTLPARNESPPIPYDASAAQIQGQLEAENFASPGDVKQFTVTGPAGGPYRIQFEGPRGNEYISQFTVSSSLTPAGAAATLTPLNEGGEGWASAGSSSCLPAPPYSLTEPTAVAAEAASLQSGTTYKFRLLAANQTGADYSRAQQFTTLPAPPQVGATSISQILAETATVHTDIDPGGGEAEYHTSYHVEYVTQRHFEAEGFTAAETSPRLDAGSAHTLQGLTAPLSGLTSNTTYHYRVVAENASSPPAGNPGPQHTFTTLSFIQEPAEACPNAHVRQQTGAALLPDCRAYELVSAANTAGYDVESNLVAGQSPYPGYPEASTASGQPRVLYGIHDGGIPATGHPTNRGVDPYIATRTENGWSTEYVGIPATPTPSAVPFSSTLLEADAALDTFVFGGSEICSPCFADGSTGQPVHLSDGELVQGMAGSESPPPTAEPAGYVARHLSADGRHLIFGSTSPFEPGAEAGKISIYERDLSTEETSLISTLPHGAGDIPCLLDCSTDGIGELAISRDGSRVLLGQLTKEEGQARFWHLFAYDAGSGETVELTPGATEGVSFDGITADGSKVFFSSEEHLTHEDEAHTGADIFIWEEGKPLTLISKGDSASCEPSADAKNEHWNTTGSEENCGAVAIGGGGGVSSADGTVYFLSPELLAGAEEPKDGTANAPNLYRAGPADDYATHFVATLESSLDGTLPPEEHPLTGSFGSFTTPAGVALDSGGDTYVLDVADTSGEAGAFVEKFNSAGKLETSFGEAGRLDGSKTPEGSFAELGAFGLPAEIAVDNDPSSGSFGDLYVPDMIHGTVDKFTPTGEFLSAITGLSDPVAVAVDPSTGDVYIAEFFGGVVVYGPHGESITTIATIPFPSSLAVASNGTSTTVYVADSSAFGQLVSPGLEGTTEAYKSSNSSPLEFSPPGESQLDPNPSYGVAVDPSDGHVYVDEGTRFSEFDPAGSQVGGASGSGTLSGSIGLAADQGKVDVSNPGTGKIAVFGPAGRRPDPATDSPAVLDSVSEPEARRTADFQTTPDGGYAAFPSTLPLAGREEETEGHSEVYRYAAAAAKLACASCSPTGEPSNGDSSLAEAGTSLTEDGRLFFTSSAALAVADTDAKKDVYEWEPQGTGNCTAESPSFGSATGACLALISAGTSTFDSGLLGATANGTDVFFFTRQSLVPQDTNGPTMKIYDARAGGGFPFTPSEVTCKASDECHGPGSNAPGQLQVGTESGTPHNYVEAPKPTTCKKGDVKKHGKCVVKPKPHKHKGKHHKRVRHERSKKHRAKKGSVHS